MLHNFPYSLGEAFVWFRFPLAMAVAFWLGDSDLSMMLVSICAGMLVMCSINLVEMVLSGCVGSAVLAGGDLVPGNYLAKACLPAFSLSAVATSARNWLQVAAIIAFLSILASLMTGERINFLIVLCGGMLAAFAWRPKLKRIVARQDRKHCRRGH